VFRGRLEAAALSSSSPFELGGRSAVQKLASPAQCQIAIAITLIVVGHVDWFGAAVMYAGLVVTTLPAGRCVTC
jgi:hypothetical protein